MKNTHKVILDSCGNPDYGQDPYKQLEGAYRIMHQCNSIEECSKAVRDYISKHNLGSGNWNGGDVFTTNNQHLGYISYNGRFHEGKHSFYEGPNA